MKREIETERELSRFLDMFQEAIKHPELAPDRLVVVSLTQEQKDSLLTKSRIELIRAISRKEPKTIGELARIVNRRIDTVSRDLAVLENYGILELVRTGRFKQPVIEKDVLMIPLKA